MDFFADIFTNIKKRYKDMGDGTHAEVVYAVGTGGGGAGGAGAAAGGAAVIDAAGVRWLWVYDKTAGTSTYVNFATGATGTPTFPLTPDADASVAVSNLPATQITPGLLAVDTLGTPGTPRVQATGAAAASIALTSTCRRFSMYATTGTWYSISGTATATSHYIAAGERLDLDCPASTTVSVLRETTDGSVRITELV